MKQLWILAVCLAASLITMAASAQAPATPSTPASSVQAALKNTLIKIDGRMFLGIFASEDDGKYPNRTLAIPDAKLRFTFIPSKDITVVTRFNINNAKNNDFDYFYLDLNNWGGILPKHVLRVGKFKIDVGEETWTDNPVESILISNSAPAISGYDGGINFRGFIASKTTYSLGVLNGTGTVESAGDDLALAAKVGQALPGNLYLSASYFNSGDLGTKSSGLKVAGLTAPPAGATNWSRALWEVDARWNYGEFGVKSVVGTPVASRFQAAAAYGQFADDVTGASDREGNYWYVEGLANITDKWYAATRYSEVKLDDAATAKLVDSPVEVNKYNRLSLGVGYRLTDVTHIKAEYSINNTKGGASEPELNQLAVGIATKF